MAQHPMMPLWTDAYLSDTKHLTTIEHGAYLLLLMAMWRSPDASLPNDGKMLARFAGVTTGQWRRMEPVLMPFFDVDGDRIRQGRLTDEREAVRQHSQSQSRKAKSRWLKNKDSANAAAQSRHCRNDASLPLPPNHRETSSLNRSSDNNADLLSEAAEPPPPKPKPDPRSEDRFEEFWTAYGHKKGRKAAERAFAKAVTQADPEEIIEGARRYAERRGPDPRFWKHPQGWLNDGRWSDEFPDAQAHGSLTVINGGSHDGTEPPRSARERRDDAARARARGLLEAARGHG